MGWGERKGVIAIALAPDSGSLGSSQSLLSLMLSPSSQGSCSYRPLIGVSQERKFHQGTLGRTVNAWLPRPGTPSNTWRFPR